MSERTGKSVPVPGRAGCRIGDAAGCKKQQIKELRSAVRGQTKPLLRIFGLPDNAGETELRRATGISTQCIDDIVGSVGNGENPSAALGFQRNAELFKELHGCLGGKRIQRSEEEAGIRDHVPQKLVRCTIVCQIATPFSGDRKFSACLPVLFENGDAAIGKLAEHPGGKHPGGSPSDNSCAERGRVIYFWRRHRICPRGFPAGQSALQFPLAFSVRSRPSAR